MFGTFGLPAARSLMKAARRRARCCTGASARGSATSVGAALEPAGIMAKEITTPDPPGAGAVRQRGQSGAPVPNGAELEGALDSLELSVGIDLYLNETTGRCDYVLPATTMYERDDFPLPFQVLQPTRSARPPRPSVPGGTGPTGVGHHRRAHPAVGTPHAGPARSRSDPESVGRLRFPAHSPRHRRRGDPALDGRRQFGLRPGGLSFRRLTHEHRTAVLGVQPARRRAAQRGGVPRARCAWCADIEAAIRR